MKSTTCFLLLLTTAQLLGQSIENEIDSLKTVLNIKNIPDSSVIEITNELGFLYRRVGDYDSAYKYADKSLALAKKAQHPWYIGRNYWDLAKLHEIEGFQMSRAKAYLDSAEQYYLKIGNDTEIADLYMDLGSIEMEIDQLADAASHFYSALRVYETLRDSVYMSRTYNKLSIIFSKQGEYEKAISEHKKSIAISKALNRSFDMGMSYNNIGIILKKQELYDSALIYYAMALAIKELEYYDYLLQFVSNNAGIVYELKGNYDTASHLFQQGLTLSMQLNQPAGKAYSLEGLASVSLAQGHIETAEKYALEAYKSARQLQNKELFREVTQTLSKIYAHKNEYEKAYRYQIDHQYYSDSLLNSESNRKITALKNQFDFEKQLRVRAFEDEQKKQILTAQLSEQKIIRNSVIAGFLIVALLTGLIYRNGQAVKESNNILRIKNEIITYQSKELQDLINTKNRFFSIISHDLRGPMTIFMGLPIMIKNLLEEKAYDELDKFADHTKNVSNQVNQLLDNLLSWSVKEEGQFPFNPQKLDITACIKENLSLYEAMANDKKISLTFPTHLPCYIFGDQNSLMTIVRNLVNNALKFTNEGGQITVAVAKHDDEIKISIKDTGIGMTDEQVQKTLSNDTMQSHSGTQGEQGLGLGLQLVREFTKMNNGNLEVTSLPGMGTSFILRFPRYSEAIASEISQPADQQA